MELDQPTLQLFLDVMAIPGVIMLATFCYLLRQANRQATAAKRASREAEARLVQVELQARQEFGAALESQCH